MAPPWVTIQSSQNVKIEGGEDEDAAATPTRPKFLWSHHYKPTYLQNCHFATQNYKNATMG